MTVVHKAGKKHSNADGLSRWALPNTPDNPAWTSEDENIFPILGINVCDLDKSYYSLIKDSYQTNPEVFELIEILINDNSSHE